MVEAWELGPSLGYLPEDGQAVEEGRSARLRRVADLHAVVEHRHAVEREHKGRGRERRRLAEACDGAALVVVVGEAHAQSAARILRGISLPRPADGRRALAPLQNVRER